MTKITTISRFIQNQRNKKKPTPYKSIADLVYDKFAVEKTDHRFTEGQLSLIMNGDWDPEDESIRLTYGLGPKPCSHCGHKKRVRSSPKKKAPLEPHEIWWKKLRPSQRRYYIWNLYKQEKANNSL